jgi:hypothetical protein
MELRHGALRRRADHARRRLLSLAHNGASLYTAQHSVLPREGTAEATANDGILSRLAYSGLARPADDSPDRLTYAGEPQHCSHDPARALQSVDITVTRFIVAKEGLEDRLDIRIPGFSLSGIFNIQSPSVMVACESLLQSLTHLELRPVFVLRRADRPLFTDNEFEQSLETCLECIGGAQNIQHILVENPRWSLDPDTWWS